MFLTFCFVAGIYVVWKRFSLCSSRLGYTGRSAQPIRLNEPYCMHVSIMLFCPDILRLINIKSLSFLHLTRTVYGTTYTWRSSCSHIALKFKVYTSNINIVLTHLSISRQINWAFLMGFLSGILLSTVSVFKHVLCLTQKPRSFAKALPMLLKVLRALNFGLV